MQVAVTAKVILDDIQGRLVQGQIVDLPDHKAMFYIERNDVQLYQTKVMNDCPSIGTESVEKKKRGRPRKEQ